MLIKTKSHSRTAPGNPDLGIIIIFFIVTLIFTFSLMKSNYGKDLLRMKASVTLRNK